MRMRDYGSYNDIVAIERRRAVPVWNVFDGGRVKESGGEQAGADSLPLDEHPA